MSTTSSNRGAEPFWLCHECGAQMRPIRTRGFPQCASCDGEFIEILDPAINPDPSHDLPQAPPVRPRSASPTRGGGFATERRAPRSSFGPASGSPRPTSPRHQDQQHQQQQQQGQGQGLDGANVLSSIFSNFFGGQPGHEHDDDDYTSPFTHGQGHDFDHGSANNNARQGEQTAERRSGLGGSGGGGGSSSRTFQFNFPGGGNGSFTIGSFGANTGSGGGNSQNPFGDSGGGMDSFFPGFPPPWSNRQNRMPGQGNTTGGSQPPGQGQTQGGQGGQGGPEGLPFPFGPAGQAGRPADPGEMLRGLMAIMSEEMGPDAPNMMFFGPGPQGQGNLGDYVMSQHGFDEVLERLMQAAGPQGPLPASDVVIEGLPRFRLDEKKLEESPFKNCPVCKDDFAVDDEVMRVPCTHIFHVDCIQPWLKVNGSCPVCRFSLVPDNANQSAQTASDQSAGVSSTNAPTAPTEGAEGSVIGGVGTAVTNMLQRLWGQSGGNNAGSASTPSTEYPPPTGPPPIQPSAPSSSSAASPLSSSAPANLAASSSTSASAPAPAPPSDRGEPAMPHRSSSFHTLGLPQSLPQFRQSHSERASPSPSPLGSATVPISPLGTHFGSTSNRDQLESQVQLSTAIPDDYRERHRKREEEQKRASEGQGPFVDDLD